MGVIMKGPMMLGRDAEVRTTAGGDQVTTLSLAYNYGKKGHDGKKPTQWVDCALWGERGPKMQEWLLKGTTWDIALEDVRIEEFKKRDGSPGFKMSARVNNIDFITGCNYGNAPAPRQAAPAPAARAPMRAAPPPSSSGFDDMSDDIPF
jgi:single-strand DNA-binding protein